jgi:hypothetical protein
MLGLIAPIPLAIAVALVLGGSLDGWATQRLRWWPVPVVALVIQLILYSPPFDAWPLIVAAGPFIGLATMFGVLLMLVRNATGQTRPACLVAALGIVLNLTVMLANDGVMPRADHLAAHPGQVTAWTADAPTLSNVTPISPETRLPLLADIVPQPGWLPSSNVFSIGDFLLAGGLTLWAFQVTYQRRRQARDQMSQLPATGASG